MPEFPIDSFEAAGWLRRPVYDYTSRGILFQAWRTNHGRIVYVEEGVKPLYMPGENLPLDGMQPPAPPPMRAPLPPEFYDIGT